MRTSVIRNPSSINKFQNQYAFIPVYARAMYSASIDDRMVIVWCLDFHSMAPPLDRNIISMVNFFLSALAFAASAYVISCLEQPHL